MELLEGINSRSSVRGFISKPVSQEMIRAILEAANRSPSFKNSQPWEVAVVTGAKQAELSKIVYDLAASGVPGKSDMPYPKSYPDAIEERTRIHGAKRFEALGIGRDDAAARETMRLANFKFFNAPCTMFFFMDKSLGEWSTMDIGIFIQSVALAAHGLGLGTCMQASLANYPEAIRNYLNIPDTKKLMVGMSLGYPDEQAPLNSYHSARESIDSFTRWY